MQRAVAGAASLPHPPPRAYLLDWIDAADEKTGRIFKILPRETPGEKSLINWIPSSLNQLLQHNKIEMWMLFWLMVK